MSNNPKISVIVPVYNVENFLVRCVDSITAQTYQNLEIILVDDGSRDGSGRLCDELAMQDSRIKVIHKLNGGLSSARNAGIDIAEGDFFAFVDSDDWIEPDTYEAMLNAAVKNDVKLVCAGRFDESEQTGEKKIGLCPPRDEVISGRELVCRIFVWENIDSAAWDKLYARELFRDIRYPFGMVTEDVPTTYRIALDAGKAEMLSKPVYHYFHRAGSITTARVSERTFHFSRHAEKVYADIRERCPECLPQARYLWVRSLVYNVQSLELADADTRLRFEQEYQQSRQALRKELGFVLTSALFSKKEKREFPILALGLYRPLRSIYHTVKKQ